MLLRNKTTYGQRNERQDEAVNGGGYDGKNHLQYIDQVNTYQLLHIKNAFYIQMQSGNT